MFEVFFTVMAFILPPLLIFAVCAKIWRFFKDHQTAASAYKPATHQVPMKPSDYNPDTHRFDPDSNKWVSGAFAKTDA